MAEEPQKVPHLHLADFGGHGSKDKMGNHKPGGIPIWAWGLGIVVMVAVYSWYRKRAAAAAAAAPVDASGSYTTTDNGVAGNGMLNVSPDLYGGTAPAAPAGYSSNASWLAAALTHMGGTGADPIHALAALQRFLNGQDLSVADQRVVNAATSAIGLPPSFDYGPGVGNLASPPAAHTTPPATLPGGPSTAAAKAAHVKAVAANIAAHKPTAAAIAANIAAHKPKVKVPTAHDKAVAANIAAHKPTAAAIAANIAAHQPHPTPKPAAPHTPKPAATAASTLYTVKPGDSLSSIAAHFYGSAGEWTRIWNGNRGTSGSLAGTRDPNKIAVGTVLHITH